MEKDFPQILEKLSWPNGLPIPVANAENQALQKEFQRLILLKSKAKAKNEKIKSRFKELKSQQKYLSQEKEQNQNLLFVHKQQLEREQNDLQNKKVEKDKIERGLKQTLKRIQEIDKSKELKKQKLQSLMMKAEKLKMETKWDEEALNAWEESLKKRDDDNELLKKFTLQDQIRYNELEVRRKILKTEYTAKNETLAKISSNINNYKNIITRTDKQISQQLIERNALINQWKESVKTLRQRDNEIEQKHKQINDNTELLQRQENVLEEQNNLLNNEQKINQNLQRDNDELAINISLTRKHYNDLIENNALFNNELNVQKTSMATMAKNLEKERCRSKDLKKYIEIDNLQILHVGKIIDELKQKEKQLENDQTTAEERLKNLQQMCETEELAEKLNLKNLERLQIILHRDIIHLNELTQNGKTLESNIKLKQTDVIGMEKSLKELDDVYNQRLETLSYVSFNVNNLTQKLYELENVDQIDVWKMDEQIQQLEATLAHHKDVKKNLKLQLNKMQEETCRLQLSITADKEQMEMMKGKFDFDKNVYEKSLKQLKLVKESCQIKMVEENLIRLKVNNIEKNIKNIEKNIFSIQKVELNLEQAMRERQLEIEGTKLILQAKRRHLDEEKGRLKADLAKGQIKIEQFKKKYHIVLMSIGKGDDGEELSITHYKIQQAQEKFMLQQTGDELDSKIKIAENEIVAMENTLKVVKLSNMAYKQSLATVSNEKMLEKQQLEQEMKDSSYVLRQHKNELKILKQQISDLKCQQNDLKSLHDVQTSDIEKLREDCQLIVKQEETKEEKLQRTKHQLKKLEKPLKKLKIDRFNRDFEIRQLQDANKKILQQLVTMSIDFNETAPTIKRYSQEYNIVLPKKKLTPSTSTFSTLSSPSPISLQSSSGGNSSKSSSRSNGYSTINKIDLSFSLK